MLAGKARTTCVSGGCGRPSRVDVFADQVWGDPSQPCAAVDGLAVRREGTRLPWRARPVPTRALPDDLQSSRASWSWKLINHGATMSSCHENRHRTCVPSREPSAALSASATACLLPGGVASNPAAASRARCCLQNGRSYRNE